MMAMAMMGLDRKILSKRIEENFVASSEPAFAAEPAHMRNELREKRIVRTFLSDCRGWPVSWEHDSLFGE